jgi:hypothetical protein
MGFRKALVPLRLLSELVVELEAEVEAEAVIINSFI